jgi:hypothetical protein
MYNEWLKSKWDYFKSILRTESEYPKNLNEQEKTVILIVQQLLSLKETELYVDPVTQECYISNGNYYIFIECPRIRIINSTFGYDVYVSTQVEIYLIKVFMNELTERRQEFKEHVMSKVDKNLQSILENILEKNNSNDQS